MRPIEMTMNSIKEGLVTAGLPVPPASILKNIAKAHYRCQEITKESSLPVFKSDVPRSRMT